MPTPYVQLPTQLDMVTVICTPDDNQRSILHETGDLNDSIHACQSPWYGGPISDQRQGPYPTYPRPSQENGGSYPDQRHWSYPTYSGPSHEYDATSTYQQPQTMVANVSHALAAPFSLLRSIPNMVPMKKNSKRRACCCCFCCC